ncbi:MAG: GAF domain-containing protein, partial [Ilumatobacteraceae bacterium]
MNGDRSSELRVAADFWDDRVLVAAAGDLDLVSVGPWSALLHAAVGSGDRDLVLDFSAVTFADAAALGVIATICDELSDGGRTVAIRGESAAVRRMLEVTGLDAALLPEPSAEDVDLGGEQLIRVASGSTNEIVDAALRLVTTLADAIVEHADGVSVTLERHGRLMTVAASNDAVLTMDGHQYDTGEGPCLEAKLDGRWYYIESLANETRWPAFVPLALEQGIHSILSSPLMTADRPLGALNIYSTTVNAFGTHERELAALFATQASGIL